MKIATHFKKLLFIFFLAVSVMVVQAADYPDTVLAAKGQIKGKSILAGIDFLASKYCRGRETGAPGMDVAAKFLTALLSASGLTPAGDNGSYFQYVPLRKVRLGEPLHLHVEDLRGGVRTVFKAQLDIDFLPIFLSGEREVDAPLVFAAYGITAPEYKYDDYKGIDATGKIVLLLRHEPRENEETAIFEGRRMSTHGTVLTKILNAQKHGAVGVLIVCDPLNHSDPTTFDRVEVGGTYWPQLTAERMKKDEDFRYMKFDPDVKIAGDDYGVRIPAVGVSGRFASSLLGAGRSLADLQKGIDKALTPNSFALAGEKISLAVRFAYEDIDAYNIVAKVEGSDLRLKEEVVLIGAHYDHMGKNNRGQVFGGADDNASGTAAVVEIAKAFQSMKIKPKRTLVFALFCAEEMGLLGSRFYVDHPIFPLEKTVAMIGLDMIGRNDIGQVNVLGKYQYPKLFAITDEANRRTINFDFNFTVEESIMGSDHYPFMRKNVPSIFFISGMHDQYHRPEDAASLIIPDKVERVAQFSFLVMWQLAEMPAGTVLR